MNVETDECLTQQKIQAVELIKLETGSGEVLIVAIMIDTYTSHDGFASIIVFS